MKPENEMTDEVRQLLDSLEEHGKNARRQKDLEALIDGLSGEWKVESGKRKTENEKHETFHFPLSTLHSWWWALGAAAAVLLLWLMIKPTTKNNLDINDEFFVERTIPVDSVKEEVEEVILEEPMIEEELLAEEKPLKPMQPQLIIPQKPNTETEKPKEVIVEKPEEIVEGEKLLAETTPSESAEKTDTSTVGSNNIPASVEENLSPLTSHLSPQSSPRRRVIRSLNLVCYECQVESEEWKVENGKWKTENGKWKTENIQLSTFNFQLSTQAQDPNMKNGAMTFELKLN